jgi:uncharacterized protein (TIGR02270 family)
MKFNRASIISAVVDQHAEDVAMHWQNRRFAVDAPHQTLNTLARIDSRLQASLDGVRIATANKQVVEKTAEREDGLSVGYLFTDIVLAIENNAMTDLHRCLTIAKAMPEGIEATNATDAVQTAFAWVSRADLGHTLPKLLNSPSRFLRNIGFSTCASHQFNLIDSFEAALIDSKASFRAAALSTIAQLCNKNYLPQCLVAITDPDPMCAFEAAKACVLLGNKNSALPALTNMASVATPSPSLSPYRADALKLLLHIQAPEEVLTTLKPIAKDPASIRLLIEAVAISGDPHYVPWLIQQMQNIKLARLAGESFSTITGVSLADTGLEAVEPEENSLSLNNEPNDEPNDDPNNDVVEMDKDDNLAWPDVEKIENWWRLNQKQYSKGTRYFMGKLPSTEHCMFVLKTGYQRQRKAAALHLSLLQPGTPLFNTTAPAWRQQRVLSRL